MFTDYFWRVVWVFVLVAGFSLACYLVYLGYIDCIAQGTPVSWK